MVTSFRSYFDPLASRGWTRASFQSLSAIGGTSKRSRVVVYQAPSMRPIRSSLFASTYWRPALITASLLAGTIRILPSTTPKLPSAISCMKVHSIETGAWAMRGTATRSDADRDRGGALRPLSSHTTRHAGPHRAVQEVEVS